MIDWLAVWGVSSVVGFLFQPVMAQFAQDLGKDLLKDVLKDVFKGIPNQILQRLKKEEIDIAAGKALKEFLEIVQQELQDADLSDEKVKDYNQPLKKFLNNKGVKEILGSTFNYDCEVLDTKRLEAIWYELKLSSLPDEFNWNKLGKRYVRKVKAIIQESPELRAIRDSQNLEKIRENTKETAGIVREFDLLQYQEGIKERYGNLKLDSLDTSGYAYNELKLWRMFIAQNVREVHELLPQVHEIPKEHQKRLRESYQQEAEISPKQMQRYKQVYFEQPSRSVLDIVNDKQNYRYIVILGDPGSGKSTLLQYLALNWATSPLDNVISLPIPLLIELRTYIRNRDLGQCKNFLEFIHQSSGSICHLNQHQLHKQLKIGSALVMFDGLDEVFDLGKREDVITDIHRFTNDYPNVQVMVTSRVIGYKPQRLRDAEFCHFMLQDLDAEQIKDFIYRWHELTFNDEVDKVRKRERLQKAIDTSKAIGELVGNPLLLTMMAILNRNQELPRDRPELYNQALRVLLHQWDVERALVEDTRLDPKTIDYKDKQAMLRQVAYHMQANEKGLAGNLISAGDLERILTSYLKSIEIDKIREVAKVLIHQLRTRNFILCYSGADYYAFVHRTFLEYFCAWEFVWQFKETQTLSIEQLKNEVFGKHWQDESWHEVLRLIAGMVELKFAGEIIDYLMAQNGEEQKFINLFLAAECLAPVTNRSVISLTATQLLNQLKGLTKYDLNYSYVLSDKETRLVFEICTKAVAAIATTWKDDPDTLPWLKSRTHSDKNSTVRQAAVHALAQGWKDDPDTLPWLTSLAQSNELPDVRRAAVRELSQGWKDDPDTLPILKSLAQADQNPLIRRAVVQELAQSWKDAPDTLSILKSRVQCDEDSVVREAAVQELAQGWKDAPDTLPILKFRAQSDEDSVVRAAAMQELIQGWKDAPDILLILKFCAQFDKNSYVRRTTVQELAKGWKDQPGMFEFLCDIAINDPFERKYNYQDNPRLAALEAIIEQYPNQYKTLPLLRNRAENDPDEQVREFANQKLVELES